MADEWDIEDIPDGDHLFMRAHRSHVREGRLLPGVFKDHRGGMSTNWTKYCTTAEEARDKARKPADNGVVSLNAGELRRVPLAVVHSPICDDSIRDRSHADVIGEKSAEVRMKLLELFTWQIRI